MNRLFSTACIFVLILLTSTKGLSQSSKVWVTISNENNVPVLSNNRQLISGDSIFNQYINSLGIFSCTKALPSSRNIKLQMVYELTATADQDELEFALTNYVNAVSGVLPAPVYDTLHTPNDYTIVSGIDNYALDLINAQQAWDITKGDSNVVVAVCDQSYSPNHSELVGKYASINPGTFTTTHGNAVAISAAGNTNNNNGLSSIGYNCKLGLYLMNYTEMLNAAYAGRKVINLSWSSGCFYNYYAQLALDEAYATGAFIVAAAGNGTACGNPSSYVYPAAYNNVFAITSIGPNDNHMRIPNDTTTTHQHNDKVDLSAPGYDVAINPAEGWYLQSSGTSFAAPYVTGTVGLMLSINPCLSQKDIDTILRISSVNIDSLNPTYIGKIGAGRLNAYAAVQMASTWPGQPLSVITQPIGITVLVGGNAQLTVSSNSSLPIYKWQRDSSGVYVDVYDGPTYNGVNTSILTINNIPVTLNNTDYRCVIKSGYCEVISHTAQLIVYEGIPPGAADTIIGPSIICFGDTVVFSVTPVDSASGYNWSITGNSTIISGANTNSITVQIFDSSVTVSVVPYNTYGNGPTTSLLVNSIPLPTGFLTGNFSVCPGDSAVLTLNVTGQGPWSGTINDSIQFNSSANPIQVVVYPDTSTNYILQELHTLDGCYAYPDYLSSTASVSLLNVSRDTMIRTVCTSQLPFQWEGMSLTNAGYYSDTLVNAVGCDSIITLQLIVVAGNPPTAPATITQTLISNTCYGRIYRYTASITNNAQGYQWLIPFSCGGIPPVIVDSGDINSSRIIRLKYFSNNPAFFTDSIKVRAYNNCGNGPYKSARLINTLLGVPAAPASITVTPLVTNVCGERKYRYKAPNLPAGTANVAAATGYLWSFSSPNPLMAQLDSGSLTSQTIVVKYASNSAALPGDSIYVKYNSACGYGPKRALKINLAALNPPVAPASITITRLVTNVCGQRTFRCTMPLAPNATSVSGAATGYLWTFTGNAANYGTIDSGSLTSRIIVLKYTSDEATFVGDSIKAQYNSNCGLSNFRAVKFSVPKLDVPLAPASITITPLTASICGSRIYRYTMPLLTAGSTTRATATGYQWNFTGILALTAVIDSGTLNSRIIRMKFVNNNPAQIGDSVKANYLSSCGDGLIRAVKLSNQAIAILPAPSSLTGLVNICSIAGTANSTRYVTSAVLGAVSYQWIIPQGAVIDSGSNGLKIRVRFISPGSNDSIAVQAMASNGCAGAKKALYLQTAGCVFMKAIVGSGKLTVTDDEFNISVFPNPTSSSFYLNANSINATRKIRCRLINVQGKCIQQMDVNSNSTISFGNGLPSGIYLLEIADGKKSKSIRLIKY